MGVKKRNTKLTRIEHEYGNFLQSLEAEAEINQTVANIKPTLPKPRQKKKKEFDVLKFKSWFRTAQDLPKHLQTWQKRKEWYQIDFVLEAIQIYEEGL